MNTFKSILAILYLRGDIIDSRDIHMFCKQFLKGNTRFPYPYFNFQGLLDFLSSSARTRISRGEVEKFYLEFKAAEALNSFAHYVAIGGTKPCESCGVEIFDFSRFASKPYFRPQTKCEDCRFIDYSGMNDDDCYDDYHGGDYRQEQYDQWRDFAKNECS